MAINLLDLEPTAISRDLKGKYILVYGQPKTGKTSFAAKFKKNLLLAFEMGYNAIDGIYAQPVQKWSDFKLVLRQLADAKVQAKFDTITIDTASIAYDLCEQYVCAQNGVQKIGDINWGGGYTAVKNEFESCLRQITLMGYGLILIAHSETKMDKVGDNDIESYRPALNKRCYEICNRLVDVIGYIGMEWDESGKSKRYLYTRQTPTIMAGSRFKYLEPKIEFGYDELVSAIGDAIDKSVELDGATVVDHSTQVIAEKLDYNAVRAEMMELWTELVGTGDNRNEDVARTILKKAEITFGHPVKLSEITEDQVDLMNLVLVDMRDLAGKQ